MDARFIAAALCVAGVLAGSAPAQGDDPRLRAIESAPDPSATVEAYAGAIADGADAFRAQHAYMARMVGLGVPEMAQQQARVIIQRDPTVGLAWAVVAFANLLDDQPAMALEQVTRAVTLTPDDPFVLGVAGQTAAWYDVLGRFEQAAAVELAAAANLRNQFSTRPAFAQAYLQATEGYQQVLDRKLEADAPPTSQAPPPPVYTEPEVVYVEPEPQVIYVEPAYVPPPTYFYTSFFSSSAFSPIRRYSRADLYRRHAFKHCEPVKRHSSGHFTDRHRHDRDGDRNRDHWRRDVGSERGGDWQRSREWDRPRDTSPPRVIRGERVSEDQPRWVRYSRPSQSRREPVRVEAPVRSQPQAERPGPSRAAVERTRTERVQASETRDSTQRERREFRSEQPRAERQSESARQSRRSGDREGSRRSSSGSEDRGRRSRR